jgi:hypothetical protein
MSENIIAASWRIGEITEDIDLLHLRYRLSAFGA